jgi:hypothetical protein
LVKQLFSLTADIETGNREGTIAQFFDSEDNASSISEHLSNLDRVVRDLWDRISTRPFQDEAPALRAQHRQRRCLVNFPVNPVFFHVWASLRIELVPIGKDGEFSAVATVATAQESISNWTRGNRTSWGSYRFPTSIFFVDDPSF